MKRIVNRYKSKCAKCGEDIPVNTIVMYDQNGDRGKKVYHTGCAGGTAEPSVTTAPLAHTSAPSAPYSGTEMPDSFFQYRRHYDSVEEFCAVVPSETNAAFIQDEMVLRSTPRCPSNKHIRNLRTDWYGVPTYQDVERVVRDGWPEGLARMEEMLKHEIPQLVGIKRKLRRGDHGDEIDIHAVNRGQLDRAWSRRARTHALNGHGHKTILFNNMTRSDIKAETLFWRGAAMVKVSDALTEAGYDVEIIVQKSNINVDLYESVRICDTFTLKPMHMPLNKMAVATVVCLAGFTRVFGFRHLTRIQEHINRTLGIAVTHLPDDMQGRDLITGFDNIHDRDDAQRVINEILASLGVARAA